MVMQHTDGVWETVSAESGLEALHETRRARAWVARHCNGMVQPALEQRLLSIERNLLAAVAADSGRALHYDSLYAGRTGRDEWASSTCLREERKLEPEPEPEPQPELGAESDMRSCLDRHVDAIVLGAATVAWALEVDHAGRTATGSANSTGARDHALESRVHELESQLAALREDCATKQAVWENEREHAVATIQQLRADLAGTSDDRAAVAIAQARVAQAEAAAAAQAKASVKLRNTIKRGARRLATTEAQALQYGAEVGQLNAKLHRLSKEMQTRDEMLAFYEQKLRQKDGQRRAALSPLSSAQIAMHAPNRPHTPPAGQPTAVWLTSGRPASPPPQKVTRSSRQRGRQRSPPQQNRAHGMPPPQHQLSARDLTLQCEADTASHVLLERAATSFRVGAEMSANNSHGLDVTSALVQSERRASVLQEEVKHLRRVQQLRSKSMS
jgi:hypothetical protein